MDVQQEALRHKRAEPQLVQFLEGYFSTKSAGDVEGTMSYFSPQLITYGDASLGFNLSYDALKAVFVQMMPMWSGSGQSYPTNILSNEQSALVAFFNTPEMFGSELQALAAVDLMGGKIVRWVDYWDGTGVNDAFYDRRAPADQYPADFKQAQVATQASPTVIEASTALQHALSAGDAEAAGRLMSDDVAYEDLALRTQIVGRTALTRYLGRVLGEIPYGETSRLRHVVGGARGGGFEWVGAPASEVRAGITALELDTNGRITRVTTVYNSRLFTSARKEQLVLASMDR